MIERKWIGMVVFCVGLLGLMASCQSGEKAEEAEQDKETSKEAPKLIKDEEAEAEMDEGIVEDTSVSKEDAEAKVPEDRSFKWDIEKDYEYRFLDENEEEITFTQSYIETIENEKGKWDRWRRSYEGKSETTDIVIMENNDGLYTGFPESEYYQTMQYPVVDGDTFDNFYETMTTVAENETITVAAGTFKHVAVVKTEDSTFIYHAPEVGTILSKNADGDVLLELLEMK